MPEHQSTTIKNHAAFIWSVADLLRGDYKQSEYGKVILPLTVIRRLDCVLEPTKAKVLAVYDKYGGPRPAPAGGGGEPVLQHLPANAGQRAGRLGQHRGPAQRVHRGVLPDGPRRDR